MLNRDLHLFTHSGLSRNRTDLSVIGVVSLGSYSSAALEKPVLLPSGLSTQARCFEIRNSQIGAQRAFGTHRCTLSS